MVKTWKKSIQVLFRNYKKKKKMKRIKHNDLTHYFLRDHAELPRAYLASCEKFFKELGKKRNKFQASSSNATRHNLFTEIEAASRKRQASSGKLDKKAL